MYVDTHCMKVGLQSAFSSFDIFFRGDISSSDISSLTARISQRMRCMCVVPADEFDNYRTLLGDINAGKRRQTTRGYGNGAERNGAEQRNAQDVNYTLK